RFTGVALTALIAGCSDGGTPTQLHPGPMAPAFQQTQNQVDDAEFGFTAGWLQGQTVQFFYHKPFFCRTPVEDGNPVGATTACEGGPDGTGDPRLGNIPILHVITPIGLQAADPAGAKITPEILTNVYLFFDVRPGQTTP